MRTEWFFIWSNLNPLHQKMHCGRFGWNFSSGSWQEHFLILLFAITLLSPLEKRQGLLFEHWTHWTFLQLGSSSSKDALCQVCLKLFRWFLRRRFLNFVNAFLLLHNYFPLEKARPFIWTNLGPFHPRMLFHVWLKLTHFFLEKMKMWKVSANADDDDNDDDVQQKIWSWLKVYYCWLGDRKVIDAYLTKCSTQNFNPQKDLETCKLGKALNANEVCPWMLMRKCLLAMLMPMLVILILILMLFNLNASYADNDADFLINITFLCCIYRWIKRWTSVLTFW